MSMYSYVYWSMHLSIREFLAAYTSVYKWRTLMYANLYFVFHRVSLTYQASFHPNLYKRKSKNLVIYTTQ